jgi:hypothetical protein
MNPRNRTRVEARTPRAINVRNYREAGRHVEEAAASGADALMRRMGELDVEWDLERRFATNASVAVLAGLVLGRLVHRAFLVFPALAGSFLLMDALWGWSPPVAGLRRLGYRTSREIEQEREALGRLLSLRRR